MRRPAVFTVLVVLLAVLFAAPGSRSAQDGTPAATPEAEVTTVRLGEGLPQGVGFPFTLWLSRTTFPPGEGTRLRDIEDAQVEYLGAIVSFVESGSVTVLVESGTVLAPAVIGEDEAMMPEATPMAGMEMAGAGTPVAPGTEIVLAAGDSIFFENARARVANASDTEEAVVLNSVLAEEARPGCPPCPMWP